MMFHCFEPEAKYRTSKYRYFVIVFCERECRVLSLLTVLAITREFHFWDSNAMIVHCFRLGFKRVESNYFSYCARISRTMHRRV